VTAVIDLEDDQRAEAALQTLREVRPDAAVLVLSHALDHAPGDGTLTRAGTLRDVVRLDLDEELRRLEAQRRAYCLRRFADGDAAVSVLIHPDPDPDALSSAFALRRLLGGDARSMPIVSPGGIRRPENQRMAKLLGISVETVTPEQLRALPRLIAVDMQPAGMCGAETAIAVIDHHPAEADYHAEFLDVRTDYGAVASMLTEYLRAADGVVIDELLATALLHGIKTDTDSLTRGVSAADVDAYAFLQEHADLGLLRRIERPSFSPEAVRTFGAALESVQVREALVVAFAGTLPPEQAHLLPEIADFCMGVENGRLSVATALIEDELVFTLRYSGKAGLDAGRLAKRIAAEGGSGGGHATMARATLPRERAEQRIGDPARGEALLDFVAGLAQEDALSRRS
jgi:nanoRNase/pAp phosphatase (c-di-AMP/oligoRNAs hydrolase)